MRTAKPAENQRNRETPGDKAARAQHHQAAPAGLPGRAIASKLQGGDRIGSKTGGEWDGRKRPASLRNAICPSGGSTDRTNQTASIARYHHHCDLWGDLWSGRMGRHRGIWESEGRLVY